MLLSQGLANLVGDVGVDMTNGAAGTSETDFSASQTGVITAVAGTDIALADKTINASTITVTYLLDSATANGEDLVEYEVNDGVSTAYNRCLTAIITKTDEYELNIIHTFRFSILI